MSKICLDSSLVKTNLFLASLETSKIVFFIFQDFNFENVRMSKECLTNTMNVVCLSKQVIETFKKSATIKK